MGNKRQRLARRNFKAVPGNGAEQSKEDKELGGLQNEIRASGSSVGTKKKKHSGKKRKVVDITDGEQGGKGDAAINAESPTKELEERAIKEAGQTSVQNKDTKIVKKPGSKHPLRVPGKKPGEGCFLCKATDHIAKFCPTKSTWDRKKICLLCRTIGHTLKNCPTSFEDQESKFCYNCGEIGHRLAECKKPIKDGGTAFAECFICKGKGHLSKSCPNNPHGIYPKGGCCKLCGGVTHLAKDCPTKNSGKRLKLQISTAAAPTSQSGGFGNRTVFKSGDDLEDDFVLEEAGTIVGALSFGSDDEKVESGVHSKVTSSLPSSKLENIDVRKESSKMQQTPKIVKFQRPK